MSSKIALSGPPRLQAGALLAAIVESSQDAILAHSTEGVVLSWNSGAERIYGYAADEIVGRKIAMIVPSDRRDELPDLYARLRRGEELNTIETARVTKDQR